MKIMQEIQVKKGFRKGFDQMTKSNEKEIRQKLKNALGVNNRTSFYNYVNGRTECKLSQAEAVQKVFNEYNITEIWG